VTQNDETLLRTQLTEGFAARISMSAQAFLPEREATGLKGVTIVAHATRGRHMGPSSRRDGMFIANSPAFAQDESPRSRRPSYPAGTTDPYSDKCRHIEKRQIRYPRRRLSLHGPSR